MGIAVGDVDEDGDLDLFVTNFFRETNTLYRSMDGLTFDDVTREAGLANSSRALLGFGTQFLDADLDGRLDLLVTNGHIDDYRHYGRPYKMPAQFYRNVGGGRFALEPAVRVGPYFSRKLLGRGLARVDWNRDGKEDAVISHLDQPVALLTNTTKRCGRYLSIRLRGVRSSRDAVGTTVVVHTCPYQKLHPAQFLLIPRHNDRDVWRGRLLLPRLFNALTPRSAAARKSQRRNAH